MNVLIWIAYTPTLTFYSLQKKTSNTHQYFQHCTTLLQTSKLSATGIKIVLMYAQCLAYIQQDWKEAHYIFQQLFQLHKVTPKNASVEWQRMLYLAILQYGNYKSFTRSLPYENI